MKKGDIKIIKGIFEKTQHLQFAPKIKAGFPSPADDYTHESIDFNRDLIRHPEATFYGRVDGDSMIEAGICNGDIVVAFVDGEFTIKYLDLSHKEQGYIELRPANKLFPTIRIDDTDNFEVWGVVIWTIKNWKR